MAPPHKESQTLARVLAVFLVSASSVYALDATANPTSSNGTGMHASVTQVFVECTNDTFVCETDRKCLPLTYVCDAINHCSDKSDELECFKYECDLKENFQCKSESFLRNSNSGGDGATPKSNSEVPRVALVLLFSPRGRATI
jgi:hypothetical protein